jgi:hypothetical protein
MHQELRMVCVADWCWVGHNTIEKVTCSSLKLASVTVYEPLQMTRY